VRRHSVESRATTLKTSLYFRVQHCKFDVFDGCVFVTRELKQVFDTFPIPYVVPLNKAQQDTGQSYCMITVRCDIK
jgi:hypothetical protein